MRMKVKVKMTMHIITLMAPNIENAKHTNSKTCIFSLPSISHVFFGLINNT
jgi:hypothetical protein